MVVERTSIGPGRRMSRSPDPRTTRKRARGRCSGSCSGVTTGRAASLQPYPERNRRLAGPGRCPARSSSERIPISEMLQEEGDDDDDEESVCLCGQAEHLLERSGNRSQRYTFPLPSPCPSSSNRPPYSIGIRSVVVSQRPLIFSDWQKLASPIQIVHLDRSGNSVRRKKPNPNRTAVRTVCCSFLLMARCFDN